MEHDHVEGYFFGEGEGLEEIHEEAILKSDLGPEEQEMTPEEANKIYNDVLDEMFPSRKGANKNNLASRFGHSRN